jgi:hypothetical protein
MTLLPSNCLVFKLAGDGMIPCDGSGVTIKLTGEAAGLLDADLVQNAAAGVLAFFRHELGRASVSPGEFSAALETALRGLGLVHIQAASGAAPGEAGLAETDLQALVGEGLELFFFQRLRAELRRQLDPSPRVLRFHSLRPCVLQLTGARRWSPRCQTMHDRIVEYLRSSLCAEPAAKPCGLVVH